MGIFSSMLKDNETIFMDSVALDYDYIPKLMPYREGEQFKIASCVKPLFANRNGRNALVYGKPGIGKTLAIKHILNELEEETDDIIPLYVNCWQKNTTYKILLEICNILGYKFTQNKKTEDLFNIVKDIVNKKSVVFVFDEVDKAEELDILYTLVEGVYRKSMILITNFKTWIESLDMRVKSRLTPEIIEFKPYSKTETQGILKNRLQYAFQKDVWNDDAIGLVVDKTVEFEDIRQGLYLMKESGNLAEERSSRVVEKNDVMEAFKKITEFSIKDSSDLDEEAKKILEVIKENTGRKIGDLFRIYEAAGAEITYKTFQRKIEKLAKGKFIRTEKIPGGAEGKTTIIHKGSADQKLSDF